MIKAYTCEQKMMILRIRTVLNDRHIHPCPLLQCWSDRETVCDCQEALLLQKSGNMAYIYQFDHICSGQLKIDQNCRDL